MGFTGSFIYYLLLYICFGGIALAGILCGKKYKDSKTSNNKIEKNN